MDERIEAFMKAVLDLEDDRNVGEGVRILLADYARQFSEIPRESYRERVDEESKRQKGTPMEAYWRGVLAVIGSGSIFPLKDK